MERANLKNSILKLAKVLREGHRVIIFPEGARTHDGGTVPFKKTFAILAKELNVPIVPVCIKGAYEALPRGSRFMRPKHIEVTYLPQIRTDLRRTDPSDSKCNRRGFGLKRLSRETPGHTLAEQSLP